MIERLLNQERPRGGPEYSQLSRQIADIRCTLGNHLGPADKELLDKLADTYIEQDHILLKSAFIDGFCTAVDIALEVLRHKLS